MLALRGACCLTWASHLVQSWVPRHLSVPSRCRGRCCCIYWIAPLDAAEGRTVHRTPKRMTQPKGQWLSMGATSGLFKAMHRPLYGSQLTWMPGHCCILMAVDQSLIFHESKDSRPQTWDRGGGCRDKRHILPPLEILPFVSVNAPFVCNSLMGLYS